MGGLIAKITGNKLILGAVVGIVGGLIVAILLVVLGVGRAQPATEAAAKDVKPTPKPAAKKAAGAEEERFGPTYTIKDRIVNLADPGGRRYLRFSVALEFAPYHPPKKASTGATTQQALYVPELDEHPEQLVTAGKENDKEFQAQVKKYAPALEDIVTTVLSSKGYQDIATLEGKDQARKEIKDRINRLFENEPPPPEGVIPALTYPPHVTNVYFTEFVIQ